MIKLQHLAIAFAVIIIPISLLLGYYVRSEIDTLKLQSTYDEKLINATYDAIKSYQINTEKNQYSVLERSERRDVEAAISTFVNSLAIGLGVSGYGENAIKPYIPAILFTLYDGYFIYAPTYNEASGKYENILRPFISYTQRYRKNNTDVYITYSLDNYITVTGLVKGEYVNKSGYLVNSNYTTDVEELRENLLLYKSGETPPFEIKEYPYIYLGGEKTYYDKDGNSKGQHWFLYRKGEQYYKNLENETDYIQDDKIFDKNAVNYITSAKEPEWTNLIKELKNITIKDLVLDEGIKNRNKDKIYGYDDDSYYIFDADKNDFESEDSIFNIHRNDMIRVSIRENLSSAIASYNAHSSTSFQMPTLKEEEWNQVTRNISVAAFVQGFPVGFKTYNNYAIINNTRNKTYIDRDSLVFIDQSNTSSEYHMIDCPKLTEGDLIGYKKTDFEQSSVEIIVSDPETDVIDTATGKISKGRNTLYYYKHTNLPCYYCIVSRNYNKVDISTNPTRLQALRQAFGRERQLLHY